MFHLSPEKKKILKKAVNVFKINHNFDTFRVEGKLYLADFYFTKKF